MEYFYCLGVSGGIYFIIKSAKDKKIDIGGVFLIVLSLYFLLR